MQVHEWRIGDDRVKSKIEIDPATQMDAGVYECTADNMYSIDRRSFKTDFSIAFDWLGNAAACQHIVTWLFFFIEWPFYCANHYIFFFYVNKDQQFDFVWHYSPSSRVVPLTELCFSQCSCSRANEHRSPFRWVRPNSCSMIQRNVSAMAQSHFCNDTKRSNW